MLTALIMASPTLEPISLETIHVNLNMYAGKWYVIGFLPTLFDKNWENTTENYKKNADGTISITTTYTKKGKQHIVHAKGFVDKDSGNSQWKVQYLWPFKADYRIIELADDYSYTVVGHPDHKFLYIMSRTPVMNEFQYRAILDRCSKKGYDIGRVRRQQQKP
jgi:apolipoprotein D and lipocalin family protein